MLIERVHRVDGIGLLDAAEMMVHGFEQGFPAVEAGLVHAAGQAEVAHLEVRLRRVRAEGKGTEGG